MPAIIFATIARTSANDGKTFAIGDLAAIELPANCTVHSADHLGIGTADLARILTLAMELGRHWRDQEGVNGALLDEIAAVTAKGDPGALAVNEFASPTEKRVRIADAIWDQVALNRQAGIPPIVELDRAAVAAMSRVEMAAGLAAAPGSIRDVMIGLAIFARHGETSMQAEHDEVFACESGPDEFSDAERAALDAASWRFSDGTWRRFV